MIKQTMTNQIAVLGPSGTFCDKAAMTFISGQQDAFEPIYYQTIDDTFFALNSNCTYSIIPIENTLDGYVQKTLDLLLEMNVTIIKEIEVPVQFGLIANANTVSDITQLFVQFKSNGQCRKFINPLNHPHIITTESNMESYYSVQDKNWGTAAIIPIHMLEQSNQLLKLQNVTDSPDNFTRFVVVTRSTDENVPLTPDHRIRVPLYIIPSHDQPGMLYNILGVFSRHNINLISIMSRPTKKSMGKYNFFIEIDAPYLQKNIVLTMLSELKAQYKIKILGMYSV